ncbi:hypothetical protein ABVN64_03000 [Mycolicibacterium conceptionense]|uniref:hypothetical protein n=1 Tax=Mycolicibacterium conceptionense TaxID=451644 RepID=UPI00336B126A
MKVICQKPGDPDHPDTPSNRQNGTGACLACQRDRNHRHRELNRAARELYRELATQGVPLDASLIAAAFRNRTEEPRQQH